jgi:preprotein translocase subunit SecA
MRGLNLYRSLDDKKAALINRVHDLSLTGRPLLIGTCSVEESEQVSAWLQQINVKHQVLNARQDRYEADIIAAAGKKGAITVATNMAGRGTDIELGPGVEELGGLHVISLSLNHSHRLDRQLYGRCARQGDPGSAEALLSLDDSSLENCRGSTMLRWISRLFYAQGKPVSGWVCRPFLHLAQHRFELQQARIRKVLMKQDKQLRRTLAFAGRFE